ncbi:MAG: hypothetical protein IJ944_06820 [Clostridia bacterium]|nr:hypothetical protein [Clostridia bacterium]
MRERETKERPQQRETQGRKSYEKKKTSSPWIKKGIYIVMALSVVAYMGYMIVVSTTKNIETDYAITYECSETINADAFIFREESIIYRETDGILAYNAENGSKIVAGSVVADVYADEEGAKNHTRVAQINKTLDSLGGFETSNNVAANAQALEGKIDETLLEYVDSAESGKYDTFVTSKANLLENLNKKQIATGQSAGVAGYISKLTAERDALVETLNPKGEVRTEKAGFFIKSSDGYEDILSVKKIDEISVSDIKSALTSTPKEVKDTAIGRVCSSDEWYISTVVPYNSSLDIRSGTSVRVNIPMLSSKQLKCTVYKAHTDAAKKETMLILSCSEMDEGLALGRKEKIEICIKTYDGLRVNSSAIRMVDNSVTGVYVLSGVTAKFVPVNVLYRDTGFAVVEYDPKTPGTLRVFDEVITKGTNLSDGKVVR